MYSGSSGAWSGAGSRLRRVFRSRSSIAASLAASVASSAIDGPLALLELTVALRRLFLRRLGLFLRRLERLLAVREGGDGDLARVDLPSTLAELSLQLGQPLRLRAAAPFRFFGRLRSRVQLRGELFAALHLVEAALELGCPRREGIALCRDLRS